MSTLRPIERRVLALREEGVETEEIARRFNRGTDHIERIIAWTEIPRTRGPRKHEGMRPLERRVIEMRSQGLSYEEIADRLRRGTDHVRRVEQYAGLRRDLGLA
jgi:DNA-binding CsgD family transcriptional regulator